MTRDRNGLEILGRDECLRLLGSVTVGRLVYVRGGVPAAVPVNIALAGDQVVFRLGTGAALAAIYDRQLLAVEVDAVDLDACCGWSINVVGAPAEVPAVLAPIAGRRLRSWLRPDQARLFALRTDDVTGRRLSPPPPTGASAAAGSTVPSWLPDR